MPITPAQRAHYISTVHELNRAVFFGCPNYENMLDAEIAAMDADDPQYNSINKPELDAYSVTHPFGSRKGSPNEEASVVARTGVTFRRKGVNA